MKVKLATQVFSASVAAAMNTNMALEGLPASAHATIELIMNFDKFFDIFNSSQMSKNRKEFNLPFMGSANRLIFKRNKWHFSRLCEFTPRKIKM